MKKIIFVLLFLGLSACSNDTLPKYSKLDGLRILALDLDKLEIQNPPAGVQNIQVTPYLSDIGGSGAINLRVQSCLDRGVSLGVMPSCENSTDVTTVDSTFNFADSERTASATPISISFTIPANFLTSYAAPLQFNGVSYLITVTATRGNTTLKSFRRVLISTKTPNQAPVISDILGDGTSLSALPNKATSLSFAATGSPESYQYMNTKEEISNLTETYEVTWFTSDGEIKSPRSRENETVLWTPPDTAPVGRSVVIVGVLRDGRGGVSVLIKKL